MTGRRGHGNDWATGLGRDGLDERRHVWPQAPVLAALGACWLFLGWPWLSGHVTIPWDAKATFMPQIQFLAQSLARGESPAWNPFVFSGHPQIADPQAEIFSPVFLVMALVTGQPSLRAVDTAVLAGVLAGMATLVVWFRDRGWHWGGGLVAAVAFGFGAAMAWRIQHTGQVLSLVYLVLALVGLERALDRRSLPWGVASGLAAGCMVLGRDQVALLGLYLLAGLVLWRWASAQRVASQVTADVKPLLAGGLAGLALIALPVLMTALLSAESNRPEIDVVGAGRGSLHPALMLTWLAPDLFGSSGEMADYWGPPSLTWQGTDLFIAQNVGQLYIGAAPILLLLVGLVSGVLWAREIRAFSVAAALMLVYALGWYTPLFRVMHAVLPGVDFYRRPADAVFEIGLLTAILAGYTAHRLFTYTLPQLSRARMAGVAGVVLAGLAAGFALADHFDTLARAWKPLAVAAGILIGGAAALGTAAWLYPLRPVLAPAVLIAATVADLAWSNGPGSATALPPATYEVLQPTTDNETIRFLQARVRASASDTRRDRVELAGLGFHWPNASMTHGLENTLGYDPVRLALYSRATGAGDHIVTPDGRRFTPLFPGYRSTLARMLGLRYVAMSAPIESTDRSLMPGDMTLLARFPDAYVYENPDTLPRVLFASTALPADFEAILVSGVWPEVDFTRTVLLDKAGAPLPAPAKSADRRPEAASGEARLVHYENTRIEIDSAAPHAGWVVLNDVWHPWWRAEVDGTPVPIHRANVLFRAVAVPAGRHRVTFTFAPVRGAVAQAWGRFSR